MKLFTLTMGCAVALLIGQAGWAADSGYGSQQGGAAPGVTAPTDTSAASAVAGEKNLQPHDKNGKPMTAEEFAKAEKERMQARTDATTNRLEARQSRWKKTPQDVVAPKAAKKMPASKGAKPAPELNVSPK